MLVEGLGLPPACLCQMSILIDDPNIMKAFSMSDKMYHLWTQLTCKGEHLVECEPMSHLRQRLYIHCHFLGPQLYDAACIQCI